MNPKMGPWRKKAFPHYDDLALLIDGIVATGDGAFRPCWQGPPAAPPPPPGTGRLPITADDQCEPSQSIVCFLLNLSFFDYFG